MITNQTIDKFIQIYQSMDKNLIEQFNEIYAENLLFIDPFHHINGLNNFKKYCAKLYDNVSSTSFILEQSISEKNQAAIQWKMHLKHPRLNKGREINFDGVTILRFDQEKVIYHQDYFDAGAMIYENIPLLRNVISYIKKGLS